MVTHHQNTWSKISNNIIKSRQQTLSEIVKQHGQQSSKIMIKYRQKHCQTTSKHRQIAMVIADIILKLLQHTCNNKPISHADATISNGNECCCICLGRAGSQGPQERPAKPRKQIVKYRLTKISNCQSSNRKGSKRMVNHRQKSGLKSSNPEINNPQTMSTIVKIDVKTHQKR
jgi:hypothetical protein